MASYQPQMPAPSGRKPMPVWVKILLVLGGLFIAGILAVAGITYYFVQKISNEPGGVMGAAIRMANPDYDVLSINEKTRTIVVRHKKTGKEGPIPFDRIQKGAIDPSDIGLSNEEAGVLNMPAWLIYPGATVLSKAGGSRNVQSTLETGDDSDKVFAFYESKLKENQYDVTSVSFTRSLVGKAKSGGRGSVTVQVLPSKDSQTRVLVVYQ